VETADLPSGALPFEISRWEVGPGQQNDLEAHASVEVWLIAQGEGIVTLDGTETRVGSGDAVVVPPQVWHQLFNDGAERVRAVSIYWRT
jgi:mannose-6-phosphate isomerase-like protein (cupin superfamily)